MFNITPEEAKEKFSTLTFKGKKLITDIFGRAEFFYVAEILPDQAVKLSGMLKTKRKEIPIEEVDCLFPGPPAGFIKDNLLHFIGSDMTFRELNRLPTIISLSELEEIKEESVEMVLFGEEHIAKREPVLILQDPFGITVKLLHPEDAPELALTDYKKTFNGYQCRSDKVFESLSLLKAGGWRVENKQGQEVLLFEKFDADFDKEEENLKLKGSLSFEGEKLPFKDYTGERQVPLEGNKIGLLPDHFKIDPVLRAPIPRLKAGLILPYVGEALFTRGDAPFIPKKTVSAAASFKGQLRPYQEEGLSWLYFLYQNRLSGFLADDMGLGKTVQTLAFLSLLPQESVFLIVMPASLKFNWSQEIEKFFPAGKGQFTLASYNEVRSSPENFSAFYDVIILDEAQAVKNKSTQTFKAIKALKGGFRLSISGTPIENRLEELVTHFNFLLPSLELNDNPSLLKRLLRPFILRRRKDDVLKELPEKVEVIVEVEQFAEEREIYHRFLSDARAQDLPSQNRIEILETILRLRQIACHSSLAGYPIEQSAKLEAALSDIEALVSEGRAVLVFSQFTSLLKLVEKSLSVPCLTFTGETKDKEKVVAAFQQEEGPQVLLMSLKAGGVGLNLTRADAVLLLDPWWNQAAEEQAISRAHRIGQKNSLLVKRYVAKDTIEEKVMELKAHKKNLAGSFVDEGIGDEMESVFDMEEMLKLIL